MMCQIKNKSKWMKKKSPTMLEKRFPHFGLQHEASFKQSGWRPLVDTQYSACQFCSTKKVALECNAIKLFLSPRRAPKLQPLHTPSQTPSTIAHPQEISVFSWFRSRNLLTNLQYVSSLLTVSSGC